MIQAEFLQNNGSPCGVTVSGHAGFAEAGQDIVCAAVTSALQMTVNGITEILKADPAVDVEENRIALRLNETNEAACSFLKALRLHLNLLQEDYPSNIQLTDLEV